MGSCQLMLDAHRQREETKQILHNSSPETEHPAVCQAEE